MNNKAFCQKVACKFNELVALTDANSFRARVVVKTNDMFLVAVSCQKDYSNIQPQYYLDELDIKEIFDNKIRDVLKRIKIRLEDCCTDIGDPKKIFGILNCYQKERVDAKLINRYYNRELITDVPYVEVAEDLAVVFYYKVQTYSEGRAVTLINNNLLNIWKITKDDLIAAAKENLSEQFEIESLFGFINSLKEGVVDEALEKKAPQFYIVKNKSEISNGAIQILNKKKILDFVNGSDYYVLPSSIHEFLIVKKDDQIDVDELKFMVVSTNENVVSPEERLSDSIYLLNGKNGELTTVR